MRLGLSLQYNMIVVILLFKIFTLYVHMRNPFFKYTVYWILSIDRMQVAYT